MTNYNTILFFAISIAMIEALSQYCLKCNSISANNTYLYVGLAGYICVALLLLKSYKYEELSKMALVWSCFSISIGFINGALFFKESITFYKIIASLLAFFAIYVSFM